jgi:fibronectin type 3 domain-containing protein
MDLYQSNQTTLITSDDDGGSGTNARISRTLSAGTWYYVKVRGYSSSTTGSYSIDVKGTVTLNPPRNLTASAGDSEVILSWDVPVSESPSGYKVYRSTSENGTYSLLGSVSTNGASVSNLTNGSTYWFYVTATYSSGDSPASNKASAVLSGPNTPVTLIVDGSAVNATLTAGIYHWYRFQTGTSGTYTIQTYGSTDTYMDLYQSNQTTLITSDDDGGSGTNARISRTLSAGTWYYVKVRGYSSSTTGSYSIDVKGTVTLNPPRNLTASAGDSEVILSWDVPVSESPSGYKVYRSTSENGTYSLLGSVSTNGASVSNLTNGSTYWFYVTATYSSGDSPASNKASAVLSGPNTPVTLIVDGSAVNATLTAGIYHWYRFQTGTSGTYTIQTYGSTDTYIDLYQSNQTTLITSDDDGGSGTNAQNKQNSQCRYLVLC